MQLKSKNSGVSLIEILVVIAIMSIVGLGALTIMQNMNKGVQSITEKQEAQEVVSSINIILQKNDVCAQALVAVPAITESLYLASMPVPLTEVDAPTATGNYAIVKVGEKLSKLSHLKVAKITLANGGRLKDGMNNASIMQERDSTTGVLQTFNIYVGTLSIFLEKTIAAEQSSYGSPKLPPLNFMLTVGFNANTGNLERCNIDSATAQVCESYFDGTFNSSSAPPQCHIPKVVSETGFSVFVNADPLSPALVVTSGKNVGVGNTNPTVKLDVAGGIRPGDSSTAAACGIGQANGEGTMRYNYSLHLMEYCNGSGWVSMSGGGSNCITVGGASQGIWYSDGAKPTCPDGYTMKGIQTWGGCSGGVCGSNVVCCQ